MSIFCSNQLSNKFTFFSAFPQTKKLKIFFVSTFPYCQNFIPKASSIAGFMTASSFHLTFSYWLAKTGSYLPSVAAVAPSWIIKTANQTCCRPVNWAKQKVKLLIPNWTVQCKYGLKDRVNIAKIGMHALVEELFFRFLLQKIILTELPRLLLKKISPSYANYVDHPIFKITRMLLLSALFALAHTSLFTVSGLLLPQLFSGFFYSGLIEQNFSLTYVTLAHFIYNVALAFFVGAFPL